MEMLEEIKTEVKMNSRQLNSIMKRLEAAKEASVAKLPDNVGLPVKNDEDLNRLEESLKDETQKQQMVCIIHS